MPDSVRYHEQKDIHECEVLAVVAVGLGRARHPNHARRQQTGPGGVRPTPASSNSARGSIVVPTTSGHEVCGDIDYYQHQGPLCLSGPLIGDLLPQIEHASQFSPGSPQNHIKQLDATGTILGCLLRTVMLVKFQSVLSLSKQKYALICFPFCHD